LQAAYRHPDVQERLGRNRWNAVIFKDTDDKNPYKLMAIMEMLIGLPTELMFKEHLANVASMSDWLGTRVKPSNPEDHRSVQAPLFALNIDGGLRPLSWTDDHGQSAYLVKDCRATSDKITVRSNEIDDLEGLNVQWSAQKLYDNSTWFVRMDPQQDLFALANSASAIVKISDSGLKQIVRDYWAE
jgi:hypothetical protein